MEQCAAHTLRKSNQWWKLLLSFQWILELFKTSCALNRPFEDLIKSQYIQAIAIIPTGLLCLPSHFKVEMLVKSKYKSSALRKVIFHALSMRTHCQTAN